MKMSHEVLVGRGFVYSMADRSYGRVQSPLSGASCPIRQRVCTPAQPRSGSHLLAAVRAHGEPGQHGQLSEPEFADRGGTLASQPGWLHGDCATAFGWIDQPDARTASAGPIQRTRSDLGCE